MRYTTEFEIPFDALERMDKDIPRRIDWQKKNCASDLGILIASKNGWKEMPEYGKRFRLEVQCMSWKDWQELKSKISELMPSCYLDALQRLFRDSESKGISETENKIRQ
jgi:hypothetical protein